jgi:hypothetical protein
MKIVVYLLFLVASLHSFSVVAQDDEPKTIKIRKESNLAKAVFDNTIYKLTVMDRFGNPRDNKIMSYKLYVKSKSDTREFQGYSNSLTPEMVTYMNKQSHALKIFFTEIVAQDDNLHPVRLPDVIDVWFPDCKNCDRKKRK